MADKIGGNRYVSERQRFPLMECVHTTSGIQCMAVFLLFHSIGKTVQLPVFQTSHFLGDLTDVLCGIWFGT